MSKMIDVFTLGGDTMAERGDFFSSMFIVMAGGCLVSYSILGYGSNTVAQVCVCVCVCVCVFVLLTNSPIFKSSSISRSLLTRQLLYQTLAHNLRREILRDTLRQDLRFFDRPENNIGALASRIDAHPQVVFELMGLYMYHKNKTKENNTTNKNHNLVYSWKLGVVIVLAGIPAVV